MTSYYSPGIGTVNITYGPNGDLTSATGEDLRVLVACDLGRRLFAIDGSTVLWSKDLPSSWPRGLAVYEGLAYYADGAEIVAVNPLTGYEHRRWALTGQPINTIDIREESGVTYLTVCFGFAGIGSVRVYTLSRGMLTTFYVNPLVAEHPRGAYWLQGWLFVSDTFGHRVYAVDKASNVKREETAVYYPNTIEPESVEKVRICAEHENRVIVWDYVTETRTLDHAAPVTPFNDVTKERADIQAAEAATAAAPPPAPPKSLCAKEYAGMDTLYSPNSAKEYSNGLLVADTDNHRVIRIRDGIVVAELTGFNNPTTAVEF